MSPVRDFDNLRDGRDFPYPPHHRAADDATYGPLSNPHDRYRAEHADKPTFEPDPHKPPLTDAALLGAIDTSIPFHVSYPDLEISGSARTREDADRIIAALILTRHLSTEMMKGLFTYKMDFRAP